MGFLQPHPYTRKKACLTFQPLCQLKLTRKQWEANTPPVNDTYKFGHERYFIQGKKAEANRKSLIFFSSINTFIYNYV